ncbi:hypothetical protein GQX73_g10674 [Xylaria multiplex]|uniref:Uncharacterized protein n=1 Tax=Xylaria multiplex TaxID=323545 RepID=A0A7C8MKH8_9PEZI|nr:hypothetical protein GQX73_g10674 [Xylaria multiplex]
MDSPLNHLQAQGLYCRPPSPSYSLQSAHASLLSSPSLSAHTSIFSSPSLSVYASPLSSPSLSSHTSLISSPSLNTTSRNYSPPTSSNVNNIPSQHHSHRNPCIVKASGEEHNRAARLVNEQSSSNISKAATAVLSNVADGTVLHSTVMLVQALLDLGAEVCFQRRKSTNMLKIALNKDQADIRSNLLERATRNCSHDILLLLAQKADEQAVNQALPIAIEQDDPEKVRILLARGANASPWCTQFLNAVEFGADEVVDELTRIIKGACQDCRDKGLVRAATFGHANKVRILLDKGADPNFERATALGATIGTGREDIGTLIVSHKSTRMRPELLDMAIADAYSKSKYQILITCLRAREGGQTETLNRVLLQAVKCNQFNLIAPLLRSKASVEYQGGAVVVAAVMSKQHKLLEVVLSSGKVSQSSMAVAIAHATELGDLQVTGDMVDVLISAGLRGDAVSQTLIRILNPKFAAGDGTFRLDLASLLLDKGGAEVNFQRGHALVLAATEGWLDILSLLLRYQPSFASLKAVMPYIMGLKDYERTIETLNMVVKFGDSNPFISEDLKAAAVSSAAEVLRHDVLEYLAQSSLSESTILAGLSAAISSGEEWVTPSGLPIIQFLLDRGALGPLVNEAFCRATKLIARDAIELLGDFISEECVNTALLDLVENSPEWHSPDDGNLWLIEYLLGRNAHGEPVNMAFLYALEAYTSTPKLASKTLLDTLLMVADVNFRHGEALKVAINRSDESLLKELVSRGASEDTMTHAFNEVIIARLGEKEVLKFLGVLSDKKLGYQPDFKRVLPGRYPPIFDCLVAHPESVKLVKHLIELGCEVDAKACTKLYDTTEPENATTLSWALSQSGVSREISSDVIKALIDAKAKNSRGDIVKKLVDAKADSRGYDRFDKAALFYASQVGDVNAVKALLKIEFRRNDGSLHEAARNLHRDCVAALIKAEFEPNFRSSRVEYNGRNALQEMTFRCDGSKRVPDMEATILSLKKGGSDPLEKWQGKTALFLALSNPQPYRITQALLNTGKWCQRTRLYFSPTVYLKRYTNKGNAAINAQLESLLRTMGCEDRYFAGLGSEQPDDAIGLPDDIAKEVKRRKDDLEKYSKAEFDHQTKIRRHYEEEQAQHELWQAQQLQKTNQKISQSAAIHQNTLHQNMEMSDQQQDALTQKNSLTELSLQNQQQLKLDFQQRTAQQKLELQGQQNVLTHQAQEHKLALQQAQNRLAQRAQDQKITTQEKQNKISKEAQRQKMLNAKKMQAIKASEERERLKNKKAMHREDLSFQRAKQRL